MSEKMCFKGAEWMKSLPEGSGLPRVLVAHPGTQHSRQTALALQKAGWLQNYVTGFYYKKWLLLAKPRAAGNGEADASVDRLRTELAQAGASFEELLEAVGAVLELDALLPFAHWITPEMMPKRFDTHFFLARMRGDAQLRHDGGETVDSLWITPDDAIVAAQDGRHTIIWPTLMNLQKLTGHATIDSLWAATGSAPIVTVLPRLVDTPQGKRMRIPPEAGYEHWEVDLGQLMGR